MSSPTTIHTTQAFTLSTPLGTDIWRKPPHIDVFTAPVYPSPLPKYDLRLFQRVRTTVSLPPSSTLRHFDNAGLILHFTNSRQGTQDKWIKAGIEFFEGKSYTSLAACDSWSDWSVVPLPVDGDESRPKVAVEAERKGKSLWLYQIVKNGAAKERRPLRELNWVFAEEEQGWEVGVGGYVTREMEGEGENDLEAEFEDGVVVEVRNWL